MLLIEKFSESFSSNKQFGVAKALPTPTPPTKTSSPGRGTLASKRARATIPKRDHASLVPIVHQLCSWRAFASFFASTSNKQRHRGAGMANALLPSSPAAAPARRRPRLLVVGHHPHRVAIAVLLSLLLLQLVDASSIRRPGTSRKESSSRPDPNAPLHLPAHCRPNRFAVSDHFNGI